jgi:flagellar biosynthesis/type III secretory pathway protein FliH
MNPSKRNVICSNCKAKVDADDVICRACNENAQNTSYESGFEDGLADGEKKGYDKGHDDGYMEGYAQAMDDATKRVNDAFSKLRYK